MHSKYLWCHIVHSINMGCWNGWRRVWILNCVDLLLCGKIHIIANQSQSAVKLDFIPDNAYCDFDVGHCNEWSGACGRELLHDIPVISTKEPLLFLQFL